MSEHSPILIEALTEREQEILLAIADGLTNQEIADTLFLALPTVKWYNSQIYSKLGVKKRQEAIEQADLLGLLNRESPSLLDVPNNLPLQSTPFIGRYQELNELDNLMNHPDVRMLTILAPGGMGKTRLALQLAERQLEKYTDGVFFVDLAPLSKHEMIASAIAEVLGLMHYDENHDLKNGVIKYLASKQMLLILDNFEHLLEGVSIIREILQLAAQVKILVTSRERLSLKGENSFVLSGMAVPMLNSDNQSEYDAVRLFLDGTQRRRSHYELSETDLPHIIEICQLVDGMPLGIELASAWMDTLSAEKIARELRESIDILESDMHGIPERHRSIRATFSRSWDRLSEAEQNTMMGISVFRGGFKLEAAETIANANIRILRGLVSKALLWIDSNGRYKIHELLRQYCQEKLAESGEQEAVLEQHASYYADYLEQAWLQYDNLEYTRNIFADMDAEYDNFIMAWEYILAHEQFKLLEKARAMFVSYASMRGRSFEFLDLIKAAVELVHSRMSNIPELQFLYGRLLLGLTSQEEGAASYVIDVGSRINKVIELLEPLGYSDELLKAYVYISHPVSWKEDYFLQLQHNLEKALALVEANGDVRQKVSVLYYMAYNHHRVGNKSEAWSCLEEGDRLREEGQLNKGYYTNTPHIEMYLDAGMIEEAELLIDESLFFAERLEDIYGISVARGYKARIALARHDIPEAKKQIASTIRWHQTHARDWQMLGALWAGYTSGLLMKIGKDGHAVEVLSFVYHHPASTSSSIDGSKRCLDELEERMDRDSFEAAYERGKDMQLKQVVADAMSFLTSSSELDA